MAYFASVFRDVTKLQAAQGKIQQMNQDLLALNERLQKAQTTAFRDGGFEQRADGQFVIEC
jgi:hypothetical protein